jgi:hypothetical protein
MIDNEQRRKTLWAGWDYAFDLLESGAISRSVDRNPTPDCAFDCDLNFSGNGLQTEQDRSGVAYQGDTPNRYSKCLGQQNET